jgi:hypothetical protein
MSTIRTREDELFSRVEFLKGRIEEELKYSRIALEQADALESDGKHRAAERRRDYSELCEWQAGQLANDLRKAERELSSVILRAMRSCYRPSYAPM